MHKFRFDVLPCKVEGGSVQVEVSLMISPKRLTVEVPDLATALSYGLGFAAEHGEQCVVCCDVLTKPKPRGFREWDARHFGFRNVFNEGKLPAAKTAAA